MASPLQAQITGLEDAQPRPQPRPPVSSTPHRPHATPPPEIVTPPPEVATPTHTPAVTSPESAAELSSRLVAMVTSGEFRQQYDRLKIVRPRGGTVEAR